MRTCILPAIGSESLASVAPESIQALLNYHHGRGRQRTAAYIRAVLRAAFKKAVKLRRMPWNPIDALDSIRVEERETEVFTAEQADAFLQAAASDRLEALFWVAISLGLRKGELMGLRIEDVDLPGGQIQVRETLQRVKLPGEKETRMIVGTPKSKASRRTLPLPACTVEALQRHFVKRSEERLLAGSAWQESGRLFTSTIGTAVDGDNLTKVFRNLCRTAGVPLIRFHDLRHSCGSFPHAQGVSPFTIQEILGHSQLVTTRRYTHADQALQRAAVDKVGTLFGRKPGLYVVCWLLQSYVIARGIHSRDSRVLHPELQPMEGHDPYHERAVDYRKTCN